MEIIKETVTSSEDYIKEPNKDLESFLKFYKEHPKQRFFQAIRNWALIPYILASDAFDAGMFNHKYLKKHNIDIRDTFFD